MVCVSGKSYMLIQGGLRGGLARRFWYYSLTFVCAWEELWN